MSDNKKLEEKKKKVVRFAQDPTIYEYEGYEYEGYEYEGYEYRDRQDDGEKDEKSSAYPKTLEQQPIEGNNPYKVFRSSLFPSSLNLDIQGKGKMLRKLGTKFNKIINEQTSRQNNSKPDYNVLLEKLEQETYIANARPSQIVTRGNNSMLLNNRNVEIQFTYSDTLQRDLENAGFSLYEKEENNQKYLAISIDPAITNKAIEEKYNNTGADLPSKLNTLKAKVDEQIAINENRIRKSPYHGIISNIKDKYKSTEDFWGKIVQEQKNISLRQKSGR